MDSPNPTEPPTPLDHREPLPSYDQPDTVLPALPYTPLYNREFDITATSPCMAATAIVASGNEPTSSLETAAYQSASSDQNVLPPLKEDVSEGGDESPVLPASHVSILDLDSSVFARPAPRPNVIVERDSPPATTPPKASSAADLLKSPTYLLPTASSLHKRVSPSPGKTTPRRMPWLPVSPHHRISTPSTPSATARATPSSLPTPTSAHKSRIPAALRSENSLRNIASPVVQYLKTNKPPPLVHQVKARPAVRDLESTLLEVENVAPSSADHSDSVLPACPLPEAVYRAPELTREHLYDVTNKDYGVAEGFGQTNSLAKVTRHRGRVQVPSAN